MPFHSTREEFKSVLFPRLPQLMSGSGKQTWEPLKEDNDHCIKPGEEVEMMCHGSHIYIPHKLRHGSMNWYHENLMHPGQSVHAEKMSNIVCWRNMHKHMDAFVNACHECQLAKKSWKKYSRLPLEQEEMHHGRGQWDHVRLECPKESVHLGQWWCTWQLTHLRFAADGTTQRA